MSAISKAVTPRVLPALGILAFAALAFAVGRWTGAAPVATSPLVSGPASVRPPRSAAPGLPTALGGWGAPTTAAAPPAPAAQSAAMVAAVTAEAAARFEPQRRALASACWPAGGLPNGVSSARLRVNVTFDRNGREIARGFQEDRRARSGELTRCIRSHGWDRLAVTPTGAPVGVTFPVHFP